MVDLEIDILIVGGGLTGVALMLALNQAGFNTRLIDSKPFTKHAHADFDARSLALSPASVRILQMLNVWPQLLNTATAINEVHVSEQGRFGKTRLYGTSATPLGYVVEMQHLSHALHQLIDTQQMINPAHLNSLNAVDGTAIISSATGDIKICAKLIVAADGADSQARALCGIKPKEKNYEQHAIVANIGLARAHQQKAYERFTSSGALALLPLTGLRASLVWVLPCDEAMRMMQIPEHEFLKKLQSTFGYSLGRLKRVGRRNLYPLKQVLMRQHVMGRVVFIGNAAHTLHPIAGQGFNLGLRDVAMLAQCIIQHGLNSEMLATYQSSRHHDQTMISQLTDGLIQLFNCRLPGMGFARSAGLIAMDNTPVLKNLISRYMRGFAGTIPDLVCGIPVTKETHERI